MLKFYVWNRIKRKIIDSGSQQTYILFKTAMPTEFVKITKFCIHKYHLYIVYIQSTQLNQATLYIVSSIEHISWLITLCLLEIKVWEKLKYYWNDKRAIKSCRGILKLLHVYGVGLFSFWRLYGDFLLPTFNSVIWSMVNGCLIELSFILFYLLNNCFIFVMSVTGESRVIRHLLSLGEESILKTFFYSLLWYSFIKLIELLS